MANRGLWDKAEERNFFLKALETATPDQLFYVTDDGRYLAYWPKGYEGKAYTLQSRNSLIGRHSEEWVTESLQPIAEQFGAYSVRDVVCHDLGLTRNSPMDVAIAKTRNKVQRPEDILLLVEVKMSIVWNWEHILETNELRAVGDYSTHRGTPGLLRSDTMLKAIGKAINIRVFGLQSSRIPIVVVGNTPITKGYFSKVDYLKQAGIIQGFYSVSPMPLDQVSSRNIKQTPEMGFLRIDQLREFEAAIVELLREEREFFSGMKAKAELGKIIDIANREQTYEQKAERFLALLRR